MLVYKVTNKINNKIYIGITTRNINIRWKEHCNLRARSSILKSAISKYGKDNFIIEEIDKAINKKDLCDKETYWIKHSNSLYPNGYNYQISGQNLSISKETRIKQSKSKLGKLNPNYGGTTTAIPIYCLTNNKIYASTAEASRELNLVTSNITRVIKKERKHVKGYVFEYIESRT